MRAQVIPSVCAQEDVHRCDHLPARRHRRGRALLFFVCFAPSALLGRAVTAPRLQWCRTDAQRMCQQPRSLVRDTPHGHARARLRCGRRVPRSLVKMRSTCDPTQIASAHRPVRPKGGSEPSVVRIPRSESRDILHDRPWKWRNATGCTAGGAGGFGATGGAGGAGGAVRSPINGGS